MTEVSQRGTMAWAIGRDLTTGNRPPPPPWCFLLILKYAAEERDGVVEEVIMGMNE